MNVYVVANVRSPLGEALVIVPDGVSRCLRRAVSRH
jgi:hypothetical protein